MSGAGRAVWLLIVLALSLPRGLEAQGVAECSSHVESLLSGVGAERREGSWRGFLLSGEARSLPLRFERAGCVGVLAVVAAGVGSFRLELVTPEGDPLTEREGTPGSGYLRFCGARGLTLVAIVRVLRGRGEVTLSSYDAAPARLPVDASACLGASEGVTTGAISVGPAPTPRSASDQERAAQRFAESLGYVRVWSRALADLDRGRLTQQVEAGDCFALELLAAEPMRAPWLRVEGGGARAWSRSARGRDVAELWLSFCVEVAGPVGLRASDRGELLTLFRLPPQGSAPALVRGDARLPYRELSHLLRRRGLQPRLLAQGMSAPGEVLQLPVRLPSAGCYGFALSPAEELLGADLELVLSDHRGNLLARELKGADQPLVYHCVAAPADLRLSIRLGEAAGRYLVWLGARAELRDPAPGATP